MELLISVLDALILLARMILMCYAGYKFLSGDKEYLTTFWYGILLMALLM